MTKRSTRSRKSTARRSLDVRSLADIPMFEKLMKKGPKMLVLVYADWCGHCTHFKEGIWNKQNLSKIHGANTASVHYNMVENTSMKNANIEGYPTVFEVKPNEEPVALNQPQSGEELVNIGNAGNNKSNNSGNMNVNSSNSNNSGNNSANMNTNANKTNNSGNMNTNANKVNNSGNMNTNANKTNNSANMNTNANKVNNSANKVNTSGNMNTNSNKTNNSTPTNTSAETATEVLSNSGSMNKAANAYSPVPPDALEDVVGNESKNNMNQTGGRLYDALLEYTAAAAPAALLLGAAVYRGKRGKNSRATRRKSSKGRKTRSQRK
jgi:hypothetical protein